MPATKPTPSHALVVTNEGVEKRYWKVLMPNTLEEPTTEDLGHASVRKVHPKYGRYGIIPVTRCKCVNQTPPVEYKGEYESLGPAKDTPR